MAEKPSLFAMLFLSPFILAIVAILFTVLIVIGVVALTVLRLWTGVIIGGVLLVIVWVLLQTKALPTEKYPWAPVVLIFIPIIGFLLGVLGERTGAFYVTPLMSKTEIITPFYASEPMTFVTGNIGIVLIFILMVCIAITLGRAKR